MMWKLSLQVSLLLISTLTGLSPFVRVTHAALLIADTGGGLKQRLTTSSLCTTTSTNRQAAPNNNEDSVVILNRRNAIQTAAAATAGLLLSTTTTTSSAAAAIAADSSSTTTTSSHNIQPITTLSDGTKFPLASFGLQIYNDEKAYELTLLALKVGYRNFFASVLAGNQKGFARAIRDSGINRNDLFICGSVVSNRASGFQNAYESTDAGCKRNMAAFAVGGIDYLDQIMLDYPGPDAASIQGQWSAFQTMHTQGLTKTLSVSNFSPAQLDAILLALDPNDSSNKQYKLQVKPVVNQLPYSVAYHPPGNSVAENMQRGVLVQAWAPLGGSLGGRFNSRIQDKCAEIGRKYNKSWAQVALRWIVQTGASFSTQSQNKKHFQQDLDIFDFELSPEDMAALSSLA